MGRRGWSRDVPDKTDETTKLRRSIGVGTISQLWGAGLAASTPTAPNKSPVADVPVRRRPERQSAMCADHGHGASPIDLTLLRSRWPTPNSSWSVRHGLPSAPCRPKRQGQAFNVLFEQPDAIARFRSVAAKAGPAGRLYTLAALRLLESAEADRIAQSLAFDGRQVLVQDSDVILGPRSVSDLVTLVKGRQIGEEFRRDRDVIAAHYHKAG